MATATTKIRLHNPTSGVATYKAADLSLGPAGVPVNIASVNTAVTNTTASGTDIQMTQTAGGSTVQWISQPLASGFTLSGTVTNNLYAKESNASANAGLRVKLAQYTGGSCGAAILTSDFGSELTTSIGAKNWTGSPTSTAFATGDRICITVDVINIGTMGGSQTVTMDYDGATDAADGSSWVQLNETVTFTADGGAGGTPTIVQWVGTPNLQNSGQALTAGGNAKFHFDHATGSGNAIVVAVWFGNVSAIGTTNTLADDASNTYNLAAQCTDSNAGAKFSQIYVALNTSPARRMTFTSTNARQYFTAYAAEVKNIATSSALDASSTNCAGTTGTSMTAGSMTPTVTGDWLFQWTWDELTHSDNQASYTAGSQSNITWSLVQSNTYEATGGQAGIYSSTSAINPTMTQGTSANWNSVAIALKSSTAGTSEISGIHIFGIQAFNVSTGDTATYTVQFPAKGNMLLVPYSAGSASAGAGDSLSSITSSPSNTWAQAGTTDDQGHNITQVYYSCNASTTNTMTLSFTQAATTFDSTVFIADVSGAASSCYDTQVSTFGNETGTGDLVSSTITPGTSNGLIVFLLAVDFDTVNAVSGGPLIQHGFLSVNNTGNTPFYENNGYASYLNPNTTAVGPTWSFMTGLGANVANWSYRAASFKAPAAGGTPKQLLTLGVGDPQ